MRRYLGVGLELGEADFDPKRYDALGPFQAAFRHEALDLPWIGFVLTAIFTPTYHAVEDAALFGVVRPGAEAWFDSDLVLLRYRLLEPIECKLGTAGGEVVAVHGGYDTCLGVPE